jgi:hypothetical protein
MLVSNLQQFIRLLAPPLRAAGLNQTADKNVTGSLENLAAVLEPFKDFDTDQLAEYLRVAQEYRQTGQIPEWVLAKKTTASKPRAPRAPKVPKLTLTDALAKLQDLQERSSQLDPAQITQGVRQLSGMTVKELQAVQHEFLGASSGKKKDDILGALEKKIQDIRSSGQRVQGILAY